MNPETHQISRRIFWRVMFGVGLTAATAGYIGGPPLCESLTSKMDLNRTAGFLGERIASPGNPEIRAKIKEQTAANPPNTLHGLLEVGFQQTISVDRSLDTARESLLALSILAQTDRQFRTRLPVYLPDGISTTPYDKATHFLTFAFLAYETMRLDKVEASRLLFPLSLMRTIVGQENIHNIDHHLKSKAHPKFGLPEYIGGLSKRENEVYQKLYHSGLAYEALSTQSEAVGASNQLLKTMIGWFGARAFGQSAEIGIQIEKYLADGVKARSSGLTDQGMTTDVAANTFGILTGLMLGRYRVIGQKGIPPILFDDYVANFGPWPKPFLPGIKNNILPPEAYFSPRRYCLKSVAGGNFNIVQLPLFNPDIQMT